MAEIKHNFEVRLVKGYGSRNRTKIVCPNFRTSWQAKKLPQKEPLIPVEERGGWIVGFLKQREYTYLLPVGAIVGLKVGADIFSFELMTPGYHNEKGEVFHQIILTVHYREFDTVKRMFQEDEFWEYVPYLDC